MLDARVILEAVLREVLAVTRVLESTVRHLGDEGDVRVDPHDTKVQVFRHAHARAVVGRPHRTGEPVFHIVGHLQGLGFGVEHLNGDDGAEDFVLDNLVILLQPGDDRWRHEVALVTNARSAGHEFCVPREAFDETHDFVELGLR